MNKSHYLILFILFSFINNSAEAGEKSAQLRVAAFYHPSTLFREMYVNSSYEFEISTRLNLCLPEVWATADYSKKFGSAVGYSDRDKVNIANIAAGIKFPFRFYENFLYYFGVGGCFGRINVDYHKGGSLQRLAFGTIVKFGMQYFIDDCYFLDMFIDYWYQPVYLDRSVDVGGFKPGVGLGLKF